MVFERFSEVVATGSMAQVVDFTILSARTVNRLKKEVEDAKVWLREQAKAIVAKSGENSTQLLGTLGAVTVFFVRPCPKAKEGMDLLRLEDLLPPNVFQSLFVKKVTVECAEDFEEKLIKLTPPQRATVESYVEVVPQTPRVNIPK